jgi:hypothetical protein
MRYYIKYITKLKFLLAFKIAYKQTFILLNIYSTFYSAGLIPL